MTIWTPDELAAGIEAARPHAPASWDETDAPGTLDYLIGLVHYALGDNAPSPELLALASVDLAGNEAQVWPVPESQELALCVSGLTLYLLRYGACLDHLTAEHAPETR